MHIANYINGDNCKTIAKFDREGCDEYWPWEVKCI